MADIQRPPSYENIDNRNPRASDETQRLQEIPLPTGARERKHKRRARSKASSSLKPNELQYSVEDVPPWYICIILGFQHYLIMFGATVSNPLVLAPALCIGVNDNIVKSELISTIFFVSGIATLLQATLGTRLPIVQGGTFTFIAPSLAILSLPKWKCPTEAVANAVPGIVDLLSNATSGANDSFLSAEEPWKLRIREIQGAIMVASIFQVVIGFTGAIGWMLKYIGPLAISPTISLAGLALFDVATGFASKQWWITLVTVVLIVAFSQYSKNISVPCLVFERGKGFRKTHFPLFRLFPVILAIGITWLICAILTVTKVFPSDPEKWGYGAQTNIRIDVLEQASWFRVPYPGQWGMPTINTAAVFGMLSGVLASMLESLGDYYACARMAGVTPPPMHAINRGIGIEGIGCILAGAFGSGSGTTSYSENIGAIGITKVASRRVIQVGAVIMLVFGVFGKFGALFVTIPDPIIGGVFIVMFGMITAVGISNLQFVDLNSSRNLFIIGFSFFFGLALPKYMADNPNCIKTGSPVVDQITTVLLRTSMFVGCLSGFILDNTIPGTDEERGLILWRKQMAPNSRPDGQQGAREPATSPYDIPWITPKLRQWKWTKYIPFLPTFQEGCSNNCCRGSNSDRPADVPADRDEVSPV
ncbi:Solute carrier family 23 member 2 [Lamellibrachia satsuma]|nr:Solute carrier family 23 member 2 [Lamellibrachia satsuma]